MSSPSPANVSAVTHSKELFKEAFKHALRTRENELCDAIHVLLHEPHQGARDITELMQEPIIQAAIDLGVWNEIDS